MTDGPTAASLSPVHAAAALALSLVVAGSARAAPASPAAEASLAILSVPGEGLWGPDLERVDRALRDGLAGVRGVVVQPSARTAEHFAEARRIGLGCNLEDVECAVKVGVLADVQQVLLVVPSLDDGVYAVSLLLADVGTATVLGRLRRHAPATGDQLERAMAASVGVLLEPKKNAGTLTVDVDRPGARVFVDGVDRGVAPIVAPVAGLAPGEHVLTVELDGFAPERRTVLVEPDAPSVVAVVLERVDDDLPPASSIASAPADPPPPPPPADARGPSALLVAGATLGALGVVGVAATGVGAGVVEAQLNEARGHDDRRALQDLGKGLVVGVAGAAVVAAAGGAILAFALVDAPAEGGP